MNLPTIEEIRKQFPDRVPDTVTAITFLERKPEADSLYKEDSFIEWVGYWKGMAVGIKKFLFGGAGLVHVVLATVALYSLIMSEPVQKPLADFKEYAAQKVLYSEIVPARFVTFGRFPELPDEKKKGPQDMSFEFPESVITASVSGSWSGLS
ncbi:MAG: hypothetical protein KIT44_07005 [Opitutaceae bacterium]|nr:hypothetical protein [Opitutaceae bacterium]